MYIRFVWPRHLVTQGGYLSAHPFPYTYKLFYAHNLFHTVLSIIVCACVCQSLTPKSNICGQAQQPRDSVT